MVSSYFTEPPTNFFLTKSCNLFLSFLFFYLSQHLSAGVFHIHSCCLPLLHIRLLPALLALPKPCTVSLLYLSQPVDHYQSFINHFFSRLKKFMIFVYHFFRVEHVSCLELTTKALKLCISWHSIRHCLQMKKILQPMGIYWNCIPNIKCINFNYTDNILGNGDKFSTPAPDTDFLNTSISNTESS